MSDTTKEMDAYNEICCGYMDAFRRADYDAQADIVDEAIEYLKTLSPQTPMWRNGMHWVTANQTLEGCLIRVCRLRRLAELKRGGRL